MKKNPEHMGLPKLPPLRPLQLNEPTDVERRRVTDLALQVQQKEAEVIRATAVLRAVLEEHRRSASKLADTLIEIGQSEFKLLDGTPVMLKSALRSKQLSDYGENPNPKGLAWVEKFGGSALVKATVTAEFDAKDIESANEVYDLIRRHPVANRLKDLKCQRRVMANTLVSWVGQLIEQKFDPPLDLLGVWRQTWAQVGKTKPKTVTIEGFKEHSDIFIIREKDDE